MSKYNIKNEVIKKSYEEYLTLNEGLSKQTIHEKLSHLRKYEEFTGFKCFSTFNKDQALAFKAKYKKAKNNRGIAMKSSTILRTLKNLKEFFEWLSHQQGYKKKVKFDDIRAFNLSRKEENASRYNKYKRCPSLEQMHAVIEAMPHETVLERRDQAIIAFCLLTAVRINVVIDTKLQHFDEHNRLIEQDPEEINTKFSKYILTYFFPVGGNVEQIVMDWVKYLKEERLFSPDRPLFPSAKNEFDQKTQKFIISNRDISDQHIMSTTTIRNIFKKAFANAGIPYFNPHCLRNTITQLGERICKTPEDFKAWSQNLGHSEVLTTFNSYGNIHEHRQGDIMKNLGK